MILGEAISITTWDRASALHHFKMDHICENQQFLN
jgi:hypothetical protein